MQNNKLSELIKIIEEKSNVSEIISDYISLEKKGNNHVGLCPFHSDSNPSMSVSDSKGIFKCFTCGAGGGPIAFVQNYEGISFIEAIKKICAKLGIDWKQYISQREIKIDPVKARGWEINQEALNFFKYNLKNTTNTSIKKYVEDRGIDNEIIDTFDIGFSSEGLFNFLLNKNFTEDEIVKYGLAKRKEDTTLQDYFINRLMFTIKDENGNIVGFSGRVIEDVKYVKYMNSPETPVFKKSDILYNFHSAKISANLKKELIVVEGFMDVIALYKSGIKNAIATMGTAFTNEHNKKISSIVNNVILAFDSDVAGINATISTAKNLLNKKSKIYVVTIPSGKDFDELMKQGEAAITQTLEDRKLFITFYKEMIYKKLDSQGDDVSFDVLKELLKVLSNSDELFISKTINEIAKRYEIDKEVVQSEFDKVKQPTKNESSSNYQEPPFVPEYIPQAPSENDVYLRDAVRELEKSTPDNRNQETLLLDVIEKKILSYAITEDFAYEHLCNNPIAFREHTNTILWREYSESKSKNLIIEDVEIAQKINDLKKWNEIQMQADESVEVDGVETYKSLIENYKALIDDYNEPRILEALNEAEFDEKPHYLEMLKKLRNK